MKTSFLHKHAISIHHACPQPRHRVLQDALESLAINNGFRKALLGLIDAQLQSKLSRDVDNKVAKRQGKYYLMEQLKGIKELGMVSDGKH
jgi:ATP-dependent Lon protease